MSKKTLLAVAILCLLMAIPLFTASAGKPEIIVAPIAGSNIFDCGDFDVVDEWAGEVRYIVADWDPPRGSIHYSTLDEFYRIDDSGVEYPRYPVHIHWVEVVRHPDHGWMTLGASIHSVIPGAGSVFIDAGRYYWDEEGNFSYQGNHQLQDLDMERFCAAFAQ